MARQFGERVTVLGMAGRDDVGPMEEFVSRHDLGHVVHAVDADGALWARFDVPYQPAWVFLDASGEVVRRHAGPLTEEELRAALEDLSA